MDRDGASGERVNREHVKALRPLLLQFAFHRDPRVAGHNINASCAISHEAEVTPRETNHIGIDFVESEVVPRPPVGRECAGAESNNSDPQGVEAAVPLAQQGQADTAGLAIVRGGLVHPRA